MKNAILISLLLIAFNSFGQDCNPEFRYDKREYCINEGTILPTHPTGGVDGIYTYTTISGGTLTLDSLTGEIDLSTSEIGKYEVNNYVETDLCEWNWLQTVEVIDDTTSPVIQLDDFTISVNPWNCLGDFSMPDPVIIDESESQIPYALEGPEEITLLSPNTTANPSDFYKIFGAPVGEHIFIFSATDPCGNTSVKEVKVTVVNLPVNLGPGGTIPIVLYYSNDVARVYATDLSGSLDGCEAFKLEYSRETDACDIDGNDTFNDDGHVGDGSSDSNASDYDPDDGEYISVCLADIDELDADGKEYGRVEVRFRVWQDSNQTDAFGDFVDLNNNGDVTDAGEFDNYNEIWHIIEVRKHPLFNTVICPSDLTLNCTQDYTDPVLIGQIIVPDTLNNGEHEVNFTPNLNACNEGTVTATYIIEDSIYCEQTITIENPFPPFTFDPGLLPDITIDCGDTIPFPPIFNSSACDFIGYTSDIDTIVTDSMNGVMLLENNYIIIDWCIYDETNGSEGLFSGTQSISVIDTMPPWPFCLSLASYEIDELPATVAATYFDLTPYDQCTYYKHLRHTFSEVPPSLDPKFDKSINSSIMTITNGSTENNILLLKVYVWDMANNYNFCIIHISLKSIHYSIDCPQNITLNCDQDYTDVSLTGSVIIPDSLELGAISVSYEPNLNACGVGDVLVTHMAGDTIVCTQTITVENSFPAFDPSSINMPNDTTVSDCNLFELQPPTWFGGPCDFIGYTEDIDTLEFTTVGEYKIEREFTVIDWCLYDETNGAEGLYFGSQEITVIDEIPPTPDCPTTAEYSIDVLPITITAISIGLGAVDNCIENKDLRFTFTETPPELDLDFDASINSSSRVLTAAEFIIGTYFIDVYHWDLAGNSAVCTVILSGLTGTEELDEGIIQLSNNYPNPFNESTTIEFNLQESRDIEITVYDIGGKEYFRLSEYLTTGEHRKTINLSDAPSGMLFYKLETNNSIAVRKLIKI